MQDWLNIFSAAVSPAEQCYSERFNSRPHLNSKMDMAVSVWVSHCAMHATHYWCHTMIPSIYQNVRRSHYKISVTVAKDCIWIFMLNFSGMKSHEMSKLSEITCVSYYLSCKRMNVDSNCLEKCNKSYCVGGKTESLHFLRCTSLWLILWENKKKNRLSS